jgi:uncharacterized protein YqgC (DUF456 family)
VTVEWLYIVAGILVLVGLAGTLLPALPGVPLVFAGMLLAAWVGDFQLIGIWTVVALAALTILATLAELLAGILGTRASGASPRAFAGAALGTLAGLPFGLVGLLLGPFLGALAGEALATQNLRQAARAGLGATVGFLFGTVAKIALAFTMVGLFALALLL